MSKNPTIQNNISETAAKTDINLLIENAVLKASVSFTEKLDSALKSSHKETEALVIKLHGSYSDDVREAKEVAANAVKKANKVQEDLEELRAKVDGIWLKATLLSASLATLASTITFFITK